jgi:trans-aconitate 2-methyltransferase
MSRLDWDGRGYHRVASVQEAWGRALLDRIPGSGYRRILDAGCGSGRLTAHLLRRFPDAELVGLDRSGPMLGQAASVLARFRGRTRLVEGDLLDRAAVEGPFDLVFSNATFHWVPDHARLFENLRGWLAPGGLLLAQCGGWRNLRRAERLTRLVGRTSEFRTRFAGFRRPVNYAGAGVTRKRLGEAGFRGVRAWLEPAPTRFPSRPAFADFIRNVILVPNLSRLETDAARAAYVETFVDRYRAEFGLPYVLDYVRLNIEARRENGRA